MDRKIIEIPMGASDSELYEYTLRIPYGFEAQIKDGYVEFKRAESEDDRIIDGFRTLLDGISRKGGLTLNKVPLQKCYAYLEKQKEQSFTHHEIDESLRDAVTHQMEDDGDVDDFVRRGIDDIALKYALLGARWQKEQKGSLRVIKDASEWEKIKEQKPAEWGEEDERILYNVKAYVGFAAGQRGVRNDAFKEAYNWLISLPERFNLQPKAEWSEEDEKDMEHIIRILDDCYAYGKHDLSKTDHENLVNKLKSLRPSWKPSEEQMEQLRSAAVLPEFGPMVTTRKQFPDLESLYNDLKKLM